MIDLVEISLVKIIRARKAKSDNRCKSKECIDAATENLAPALASKETQAIHAAKEHQTRSLEKHLWNDHTI